MKLSLLLSLLQAADIRLGAALEFAHFAGFRASIVSKQTEQPV